MLERSEKFLGLATAQLVEKERGAQSLKQEGHTGFDATAHCDGQQPVLLASESSKCNVHCASQACGERPQ